MNLFVALPEFAVVALGLALLLLDWWTPSAQKRSLGWVAVAMLGLLLAGSVVFDLPTPQFAFGQMYVVDQLALFFKRFFLITAIFVLVMSTEFTDRFPAGVVEYYALILFALAGMMWAASANDLCLLFVSVELVTVTFYVLIGFERSRLAALEAGVKYLVMGAMASAFLVYGIALVFGCTGATAFGQVAAAARDSALSPISQLGLILVLVGLGFKIAAAPFQIWAPDVYQGAPTPTTALLALGSKAAGFVLLLRVLFMMAPEFATQWQSMLLVVSGATIIYGNLCAIPQRNLQRLMGYSSIAHAGYLLLGVAALSANGVTAVLFYFGAYLFAVLAAFTVICLALRQADIQDLSALAGLHQRSPLLAATLALAMISLAGIPPLAGFFGKFLLLKAILEQGSICVGCYWLAGAALIGIVISLYYYLNVVRAIYWSKAPTDSEPINVSPPMKLALGICVLGLFYFGVMPGALLAWAEQAARMFNLS